jgi:hypothetical protein
MEYNGLSFRQHTLQRYKENEKMDVRMKKKGRKNHFFRGKFGGLEK